MKIAIIGTRGIPNNYGGYEQITEVLAEGLINKGHDVTVYNSHKHPNQSKKWKGIMIKHCYDPEYIIGTAGQFIYDLNCIRHARKQNFDVWLFMGYTSSSIWQMLFPKNAAIISNMDGMEWKRAKYSKPVQQFLKYAEKLAVKHSQFHIADALAIKEYVNDKYGINAHYIPYGANVHSEQNEAELHTFRLTKADYFLLIARMEPENNIEMILDGFHASNSEKKFVVIGKTENKFGKRLLKKYKGDERIKFLGAIYHQQTVHSLRANAQLYFHGHSVGGTNPSLLEAMASGVLIVAHDNVFNKSVLGSDAFYFTDAEKVKEIIEAKKCAKTKAAFIASNYKKIKQQYNWNVIIDSYADFICRCHKSFQSEKHIYYKRYAFK